MLRSSKALSPLVLLSAALLLPATAQAQEAPAKKTAKARTALQLHVDFFDRNGDGFINTYETAAGLRAIGLPGGRVAAWLAAKAIHIGLPKTHGGGHWWQRFTIDTAIIHKGVHGSDTGAYDDNGNYVHARYLAIFVYDTDKNNAIDTKELENLYAGNKTKSGGLASKAEFKILMVVAGVKNPKTGLKELSRDTLRSLYDGTLFYKLERRENAKKARKAKARADMLKGMQNRLKGMFR
jgi:peroxygenase